MEKKYKIIIGVLVVLLAAALCVICFLLGRDAKKEEPKNESETKEIEKKEDSEEKEKDEEKEEEPTKETTKKEEKQDYKIKEVLFDTTSYGNDDVEKVELTSDGVVLVTITGTENDVNKKEIAKDVVKTYLLYAITEAINGRIYDSVRNKLNKVEKICEYFDLDYDELYQEAYYHNGTMKYKAKKER
jgi:flagellar basal body-associated protein FliL